MRVLIVFVLMSVLATGQDGKPVVVVDVTETAVAAARNDKPILPDDYGQRQSGGIAATWTTPVTVEPVQTQQSDSITRLPGVTLHTADGPPGRTWCAPCNKQTQILQAAGMMDAAGKPLGLFRVVKGGGATRPGGPSSVPRWEVDDTDEVHIGVRTAETLKPWLEYHAKKVQQQASSVVRRSKSDLEAWVKGNYTPQTQLTTDVSPRSNVWNHLTDGSGGTHTFTREQVSGMPQWVALALHDAVHQEPPRITPFREQSQAVQSIPKNSPVEWTVDVDGSGSRAILAAVIEAVRRQDDSTPAVQGFLPALPVDVDDSLLKVLDSLMTGDGYGSDSFRVKWGTGTRRIEFKPGIQVWVKKVVEADATITAIEVSGREVTLSLSGTIVNTLKVRLK